MILILFPCTAHFSGLCRYVGLAWRTGELDKAQFYIDQAEKACTRAAYEPGLNYCKGLFKKYVLHVQYTVKSLEPASLVLWGAL